ncbi:MAG: putative toxin-antitoxin system toxin component, PIN family [Pseudomonadota bacterium]
MRIILDTNVAVSALPWQGTAHQLLQAIRQRQGAQLFSSTALLAELLDVLSRPFAVKRLALIGKTAREVLADYLEAVELVEPTSPEALA